MPKISLVIPAFDEEEHLPDLLDSVDQARRAYHRGADEVEVIVADNASTDRTAAIAGARGCRVVPVEKRVIAAARNGGGHAATGEILAFVDADSLIHAETFNAIERTMATGRVVVGATGARPSRMSFGIFVTWNLFGTAILRLAGVDTGVVFCNRDDWETVGGYNEERKWAEDVELLFAMKRLGRSRGQRFERVRGVQVVTSARKFDVHGDWHFFAIIARALFFLIVDRTAFDKFARTYWYRRDKR